MSMSINQKQISPNPLLPKSNADRSRDGDALEAALAAIEPWVVFEPGSPEITSAAEPCLRRPRSPSRVVELGKQKRVHMTSPDTHPRHRPRCRT